MKTRVLGAHDEVILAEFLMPRIESSMFLRSNSLAAGLVDQGDRYHGTYVGAFESGDLVGVAAHYWNGMMILQAPGCAGVLAAAVETASPRPVAGVIGPLDQTIEALDTLGIPRDTLHTDSPEILYGLSLDALVMPPVRDGQALKVRVPRQADLSLLIEWTLAYEQEAMGIEPTPNRRAEVSQNVERAIEAGTLYVMSDQGVLVSKTAFNAEVPGMVQIGGVWTPPSHRRRGYARTLVAHHLLTARDRGVERAILFTGYDNVAAQKAYEALGFQRIGDYAIMVVDG